MEISFHRVNLHKKFRLLGEDIIYMRIKKTKYRNSMVNAMSEQGNLIRLSDHDIVIIEDKK